jgi:restriction system protein
LPIPDYQTVMLPLLKLAAVGETRVPDAAVRIGDQFGLTPAERDQLLPSGRQRILHNRVHWAKFYMSKAGLIETTRRGWFVASQAGRTLLATDPKRIDLHTLFAIPSFVEFYKGGSPESDTENKDGSPSVSVAAASTTAIAQITPEEQIDALLLTQNATLRDDLLHRILQNSPSFFEGVILDLLVGMGYGGSRLNAAHQLGRTGDGGIDGVINEDALGLDRVYVQAKRYAIGNGVGRPDVQGFVGSLVGFGATKGVFVTTSAFSQQAVDFVRHLSQRIILIDGHRLASLMIEHNVGVRVNRTIEFKRLDEDFFSEDE